MPLASKDGKGIHTGRVNKILHWLTFVVLMKNKMGLLT